MNVGRWQKANNIPIKYLTPRYKTSQAKILIQVKSKQPFEIHKLPIKTYFLFLLKLHNFSYFSKMLLFKFQLSSQICSQIIYNNFPMNKYFLQRLKSYVTLGSCKFADKNTNISKYKYKYKFSYSSIQASLWLQSKMLHPDLQMR